MERQITIIARKQVTSRGASFYKFSAHINGYWYQIRFKKSAGSRPEASGVYSLTADADDFSVSHGKIYTGRDGKQHQENDIIWIAKYTALTRISDEELRKRDRAEIDRIFGDDSLPF